LARNLVEHRRDWHEETLKDAGTYITRLSKAEHWPARVETAAELSLLPF